MDERLRQLVQTASLAMGAWLGMRLLASYSVTLTVLLWAWAVVNVALCWLLRYQRGVLSPAYAVPLVKQYIDWIGRIIAEQAPVEQSNVELAELLAQSDEELTEALAGVKQLVRGHDDVVDCVAHHVRLALQLRRGRTSDRAHQGPLGSFLIVGPDGVGKRYLVRAVAGALYRQETVLAFECDKLGGDPAAALFGGKSSTGALIDSVRRRPCQVVLLERIELLPRDVVDRLTEILQYGVAIAPDTSRRVSFQHCLFFFTTARRHEPLVRLADRHLPMDTWRRQVAEVLSMDAGIESSLIAALSEAVVCRPLDDLTKAEVVAAIMRNECAKFNVRLTAVAPEILVGEVGHIDPAAGFSRVPARVRQMLRGPLAAATARGRGEMSLRAIPRPAQGAAVHV